MEWNLREIFVFMKLLDRHRKEIKKLGGYVQWGNYLSITFRKRNKNEHQCAKLYKSFVKEVLMTLFLFCLYFIHSLQNERGKE
jgi:hypothetical protein